MLKLTGPSDAEYVALVKRQRQFVGELAAKLVKKPQAAVDLGNGETLTTVELDAAAAILRHWANLPIVKPKRGRGRPPKFPDGEAALLVETDARKVSRADAIALAAVHFDVSGKAITNAVKKHGAEAKAFLNMPGMQVHPKSVSPIPRAKPVRRSRRK